MIAKKFFCAILLVLLVSSLYAEIDIYFSPDGGFAPVNNERRIQMMDGTTRLANLNDALLAMIDNIERGSTFKMSMYSFDILEIQEAMIRAARDRGVKIKLLMDAIMGYTVAMRAPFYARILEEHRLAKEENREFDFQVREMKPESMKDRGRFVKLPDGTERVGTMHEKFGFIIPRGCKIPLHGFCGSANITGLAGTMYAENRVFFTDEPGMGRQLAEEFARLWNEYGTNVTEVCQTEIFIPAPKNTAEVQIISNAKPVDEEGFQRIDKHILDMMEKVYRNGGDISIAMFSFTHKVLADKLIELAERHRNNNITIRLLVDLQQMDIGVQKDSQVPYLEKMIKLKRLNNFEIRYRWRSNVYTWDYGNTNTFALLHWRDPLLHHKCMIVNKNRMSLGSYNWTWGGELRNFENVMLYNGTMRTHKAIIDRFLAEFDIIWNSMKPEGKPTKVYGKQDPQVVLAPHGIALKQKIEAAFHDPDCRAIMNLIDPYVPFKPAVPVKVERFVCTFDLLEEKTGLDPKVLKEKIEILEDATLILLNEENAYVLAD